MNDLPTPRRAPPLAAPPHDPYSLLLGGWIGPEPASGWRVRRLHHAEIGAGSQALVLSPAPGAERSAAEPSGSFGGLRLPVNVAVGPQGQVLLLDPVSGRLLRFDPCYCEFKALPCTTRAVHGEVAGERPLPAPARARRVPLDQLRDAAAIAACGNALYIADSGHRRIVQWDLHSLVPRRELRLPGAERAQLAHAWAPGSLAFDGKGRLYAADPINRRVDRFDARGVWQRRFLAPRSIWHIAIDCEDRLHGLLMEVSGLWPVAVAGSSALWQWQSPGPLAPEVVRWDRDDEAPVTLELRSDRLEGFACPPLAIDADGRLHLPYGDDTHVGATPCAELPQAAPLFDARGHRVRAEGQVLAARYRRRGTYFSRALDSEIDDCTWHRVELRGCIPSGCSVAMRTLAADIVLNEAELDDLGDDAWSTAIVATTMAEGRWDALIRSQPGRHAWLRLELAGDGFETPQLDAVLVEYPRISLRRYLPAVFGMEPTGADFTDRFTAIFDASLRSIEGRLDRQAALFDPMSAPAEGLDGHADFLGWLASWIGVALSRDWPESRRRQYLKSAARWYPHRGTPAGLQGQLLLLLGLDRAAAGCADEHPAPRRHCLPHHPAARCEPLPLNCGPAAARLPAQPPQLLLEHFKLRRWLFAGRARLGDDSVLWGERIVNRSQLSASARAGHSQLIGTPDPLRDPLLVHANRVSVFVPACVRERPAEERALRQLLAAEVPAHVQADLHLVEPRFRVGVQAMVGLDSVIARTPRGDALGGDRLGQGTVLPASPDAPKTGRMRVGSPAPLA